MLWEVFWLYQTQIPQEHQWQNTGTRMLADLSQPLTEKKNLDFLKKNLQHKTNQPKKTHQKAPVKQQQQN